MNERPIRYLVLRDQRQWDDAVSLVGLVPRLDGALLLEGLPGLPSGSAMLGAAPFDTALSGVAVAKDATTYRTITETDGRISIVDPVCGHSEVLSIPTDAGQRGLMFPRGLLLVNDQLLVADSANGRVLVFDLPSLHQRDEWTAGLQEPTCLAVDSSGRVYVVDSGKVLRFSATGTTDTVFNTAMAAHLGMTTPFAITVDAQDRVYVTDASADVILVFDATGQALAPIASPVQGIFRPRALVAGGARLYVADAESGSLWVYDFAANLWHGTIDSYRGPVAALAVDEMGTLFLKPGLDDSLHRLEARMATVRSGSLLVGPVDAGEGAVWERVWVEADIPEESSVLLEVAASHDETTPFGNLVWNRAPSLDLLLRTLVARDETRFLWLRVTLHSHDGRSSPLLRQVQASTTEASYMDYLPSIYRRDDAPSQFLERWLALFRSELGDWDRALDELPREFDTRTVAEAELGTLAEWVALDLPVRMDVPEQRRMLADTPALYRQRGTPTGLRELVRRSFGAAIHLFEAFRERQVWQLGVGLGLGLDTALPAGTPDGVIVPGFTYADRRLSGLRGDYYSGERFEVLRHSKVDRVVNFPRDEHGTLIVLDITAYMPTGTPVTNSSYRWSGQVQTRFSETYTFRTESDSQVRLWVSNRLLIDNWSFPSSREERGQIKLERGKWYPLTLEISSRTPQASIQLWWSSASQRSEMIPEDCLYSVLDESAELEPLHHDGCELLTVGQVVVGQSRPQTSDDYGTALADDSAHLFTVMVPAAQVPLAAQRQALRDMIEAEKPAHTDFNLCLVEPRMRVGVQARVGIDSIVAGAGSPMSLGTTALGTDSYLSGDAPATVPSRLAHKRDLEAPVPID